MSYNIEPSAEVSIPHTVYGIQQNKDEHRKTTHSLRNDRIMPWQGGPLMCHRVFSLPRTVLLGSRVRHNALAAHNTSIYVILLNLHASQAQPGGWRGAWVYQRNNELGRGSHNFSLLVATLSTLLPVTGVYCLFLRDTCESPCFAGVGHRRDGIGRPSESYEGVHVRVFRGRLDGAEACVARAGKPCTQSAGGGSPRETEYCPGSPPAHLGPRNPLLTKPCKQRERCRPQQLSPHHGLDRDEVETRFDRGDRKKSKSGPGAFVQLSLEIFWFQPQATNTFILSSIAHGVLKRDQTLKDDGSLPDGLQNVTLFEEGREAAADTHTHEDTHSLRDMIRPLMNQIGQRKKAKNGPKSFRDCLQLVEPRHPLLATSKVPCQGIQLKSTHATHSTPMPLKNRHNTPPASSDARVFEGGRKSRWSLHDPVSLVGKLEYVSVDDDDEAKVEEGRRVPQWVLVADGTLMSNPCPGGEGCTCRWSHVGTECVCVCVTAIRDGTVSVSAPVGGCRDVADAEIKKLRENQESMNVLDKGSRLECWPVDMLVRPPAQVQVKREKVSMKVQPKEEKTNTRKLTKRKRRQPTPELEATPEPPIRASSSGRMIRRPKR